MGTPNDLATFWKFHADNQNKLIVNGQESDLGERQSWLLLFLSTDMYHWAYICIHTVCYHVI
jgi:hypothetical protein